MRLQTINFDLRTATITYFYLEDLLARLPEVCGFAKNIDAGTCYDVLDLLYEHPQYRGCEEDSDYAAAAVLVSVATSLMFMRIASK
jgi:hypothetical protein